MAGRNHPRTCAARHAGGGPGAVVGQQAARARCRAAYSDRVKSILLAATGEAVIKGLTDDLSQVARGASHDETQLVDVAVHACLLLNSLERVIFLTPDDLTLARAFVDRAVGEGYRTVIVPTKIASRLRGLVDFSGRTVMDLRQFRKSWDESFAFTWVSPADLTAAERRVFGFTPAILELRGGRPSVVSDIAVSETMRLHAGSYQEAVGLWEASTRRIVVKRDQLRSLRTYAGVLLHEVAHAVSGAPDVSMSFESALTEELGAIAELAVIPDDDQARTFLAEAERAAAERLLVAAPTDEPVVVEPPARPAPRPPTSSCVDCGAPLVPTGRPGRPAVRCATCRSAGAKAPRRAADAGGIAR